VSHFDAQRLVELRPGQCQRLNATYTHITPMLPARADPALSVAQHLPDPEEHKHRRTRRNAARRLLGQHQI